MTLVKVLYEQIHKKFMNEGSYTQDSNFSNNFESRSQGRTHTQSLQNLAQKYSGTAILINTMGARNDTKNMNIPSFKLRLGVTQNLKTVEKPLRL